VRSCLIVLVAVLFLAGCGAGYDVATVTEFRTEAYRAFRNWKDNSMLHEDEPWYDDIVESYRENCEEMGLPASGKFSSMDEEGCEKIILMSDPDLAEWMKEHGIRKKAADEPGD
jgi:hypothetical protein